MKLLRALNIRQHAGGRWALLGGIILWISSTIASPAQATIMDFTIDPGSTFFSELSTFTLDDGGGGIFAASFTQWNIITVPPFGVTFSGLTPAVPATISRNEGTGPAPFFEMILTQSDGGVALNLNLESNFTWHAVASKNNGVTVIQDVGRYSAVASSVPEPAVLVLLATGLLVLAGSRWLLRRGALQQLG